MKWRGHGLCIGIPLHPRAVLKALRDFGTAKQALVGVTIPCFFTRRDADVKVDAIETAEGLLIKLTELDPVEQLLNQQELATWHMHSHRKSSTDAHQRRIICATDLITMPRLAQEESESPVGAICDSTPH